MTRPKWWPETLPISELTDEQIRNFWDRVQYKNLDDCWLWTGGQERHGYGRFSMGKSNDWRFAHRISWVLAYGIIPRGFCILHHCDTPLCVNPTHLFLGTRKDNAIDCIRKNRKNPLYGMANSNAKLTDSQVIRIRLVYKSHSRIMGTRALGKEYNVDHSIISEIVNYKSWKCLL